MKDDHGWTPLMCAAMSTEHSRIKKVYEQAGHQLALVDLAPTLSPSRLSSIYKPPGLVLSEDGMEVWVCKSLKTYILLGQFMF